MKRILFLVLLFTNSLVAEPRFELNQTALDDYVHSVDESYKYEVIERITGEGFTTYIVDLTSQTFLTNKDINRTKWKHWLIIVSPDQIKHTTGMLVIGGGDNDGSVPKEPDQLALEYAKATNSVVATLGMVPNQPLTFVGENKPRWEDAIIAYSWDKYLTTGEERWPLRMAMTKSAVAAMDTIQSILLEEENKEIKKFVVTGASKRGDMEITDWWASEEMRSLIRLVDPFSMKERFEMPKSLVNAAGDEFFLPTSSQFYFDELPGEKYLRYVPNANHNVSEGTDALETILAFYASILNGVDRPKFSWELKKDGSIRVLSESKVKEVIMWSATNQKARDFRKDTIGNSWESKVLQRNEDGTYLGKPTKPKKGWKAYFIEMTYETPFGLNLKLTTPVRVIPDTLPFEYQTPKKPKKGFLSK